MLVRREIAFLGRSPHCAAVIEIRHHAIAALIPLSACRLVLQSEFHIVETFRRGFEHKFTARLSLERIATIIPGRLSLGPLRKLANDLILLRSTKAFFGAVFIMHSNHGRQTIIRSRM